MKSMIKWLVAAISSLIIFLASLGYYASSQILFFKLRDVEVSKRRETHAKRLNMEEFQEQKQDDVLTRTRFDYSINKISGIPMRPIDGLYFATVSARTKSARSNT